MTHPFKKQVVTGQELADSRYGNIGASNASDRGEKPQEEFTASPPRQISNLGKVRK